ncbi:MAG: class II aldolase/adducin family protein [Ignavibacteriales bacterium]|nr:class II aldolase/adducin family protein [Ignavibacteriales bacterium]
MSEQLTDRREALLKLSHELGREDRGWAILGEGNASARVDTESFLVKASGSSLGTLRKEELVQCKSLQLLSLMDRRSATDQEVDSALYACRVGEDTKKPSVEAVFHAYLLSLPGIAFVGHTHAPAVNQVLCSRRAREFAVKRIFPDEAICCGTESVFIPYTDPGLKLAQAIKKTTESYHKRKRIYPRVIVLQNHGIITIGGTTQAVLAAMMMAEKAATIWVGAVALGGPVFMTKQQVDRIATRQDEEVRRRAMGI